MWSCIDSYFPCQRICSYPIFNEESCSVVCICWRTTICGGILWFLCAALLEVLHKQFTFHLKKALQHFNEKFTLAARDKFLLLSPSFRNVYGNKDLWFLSYSDSVLFSPLARTWSIKQGTCSPLLRAELELRFCYPCQLWESLKI